MLWRIQSTDGMDAGGVSWSAKVSCVSDLPWDLQQTAAFAGELGVSVS